MFGFRVFLGRLAGICDLILEIYLPYDMEINIFLFILCRSPVTELDGGNSVLRIEAPEKRKCQFHYVSPN